MTAKDVKRILYINPDSSDRLNDQEEGGLLTDG